MDELPFELLNIILRLFDVEDLSNWFQTCHQFMNITREKIQHLRATTFTLIPFGWICQFRQLLSIDHNIVLDIDNYVSILTLMPNIPEVNLYMEHDWLLPIPMFGYLHLIPETTRILLGSQLFLFHQKQWWMTEGIRPFFSQWFKRRHKQYVPIMLESWIHISPPFKELLRDYSADEEIANILIEFADIGIMFTEMIESVVDLYSFPILQHHFPYLENVYPADFHIIRDDFLTWLAIPLTVENLPQFNLPGSNLARITSLHQRFMQLI